MALQYKTIALSGLKAVTDDGPGGFEGYMSRFGELDEVGDIVAPGAYAKTIEEFLRMGFSAHSHDWSYNGLVGMPMEAKEDKVGFYVKHIFHSTPDAQNVRIKAQERMQNGKQVSFSIGYDTPDGVIIIPASDYATEIPKYSSPEALAANLTKAKQFKRVRVLTNIYLYECSIVTAPALRSAAATDVKGAARKSGQNGTPSRFNSPRFSIDTSDKAAVEARIKAGVNIKGLFEDEFQERTTSMWFLTSVLCDAVWELDWLAWLAEDQDYTDFDYEGQLTELVNEFAAHFIAAMLAKYQARTMGEDLEDDGDPGIGYLSMLSQAHKGHLVDGLPFRVHLSAVVNAVKELAERSEKRAASRTKEGRTLSSANVTEFESIRDNLRSEADRIDAVLESAKPKADAGKGRTLDPELEAELNRILVRDALFRINGE